ncbi:MAG: hypothetical protein IKZ81_04830, partial [Clostridia bacterium]|nr:hypothetical protein [Clostridia bacterium]
MSYYNSGSWSAWEDVVESDDCEGAFPDEGYIETKGTKVKFQAIAYSDEKPLLAVYSDDYVLEYLKFSVEAGENNTGTYSRLPANACSLAAGEKFAFEVRNISTSSESPTIEIAIFAINAKDFYDQFVLYHEVTAAPPKGGSLPAIEISSWSDEIKLCGRYEIVAVIQEETTGQTGTVLGNLEVKEPISTVVNIAGDVSDDYDGVTSFREAIAACGENDTVTIEHGIEVLNLNNTITIDKPVRIDLTFDNSDGSIDDPYGLTFGTALDANLKCRIFKVISGGELNIRGMALIRGKSSENGGGILIDGGSATLEQCRLFDCKSGRAGGGIYVKDGRLIMNGCTFKCTVSGYGGAIASSEDGEIDMLNCTLFLNESNAGAIYAGGRLSAINSTFVENKCKSSGGSAVTAASGSDVTLVNCVAPGVDALNGNVKVYGCVLGETEYAGEANGSKLNVSASELFKTDVSGAVIWDALGSWRCITYVPFLSKTAEMPTSVRNAGGKIALYDGENTVMTDITSVFSDDELAKDVLGNPRDGFCGSIKSKIENTETEYAYFGVIVYTYEGKDAALICACYDDEDRLTASG